MVGSAKVFIDGTLADQMLLINYYW